jgi:hypothetical protein
MSQGNLYARLFQLQFLDVDRTVKEKPAAPAASGNETAEEVEPTTTYDDPYEDKGGTGPW